jgi:hypothetical protein
MSFAAGDFGVPGCCALDVDSQSTANTKAQNRDFIGFFFEEIGNRGTKDPRFFPQWSILFPASTLPTVTADSAGKNTL